MNKCLYCGNNVKNKYCNVSCQNRHLNPLRAKKIHQVEIYCIKCGCKFNKILTRANSYIKKYCNDCNPYNKIVEYNECKYCSKVYINKVEESLIQHELRCKKNPFAIKIVVSDITRKKLSDLAKNRPHIHIEYTKEQLNDMSIKSKEYNQKYWTAENKIKHSILMSNIAANNPNSYSASNVSGRTKSYDTIDSYNNKTKIKGTWELLFSKFLNFNSIKWTNIIHEEIFYMWNGIKHRYYPDFYLPEYNIYVEIKGYKRDRDIEKWKVLKNLIVLQKKEIFSIKDGLYTKSEFENEILRVSETK